ncbi:hypothetical protein F2P56_012863 [Juglans regia]|uniref:Uncharacterized protein LOC108995863 n=2 Tax=Juglans regia TaxID=51240 RepID=A0A2I4F5W7_JUGRE|nr:uncharacterized protein LOC108995863 [Juglans regia]KAF5468731.1 hypothetical protein F2P56_012863 [Juglans regia]
MATRVESFGPYFVCGGVDHLAQECLAFAEMRGMYEKQCNVLGMYKKPFAPFYDTYNPGSHNHPNFSWKSKNQKPAQPPSTYHTPYHASSSSRNSLEDAIHAFIEAQSKTNQKFESLIMQEVNSIVTRSDKSLHILTTDKSEDVEKDQSNDGAELPKETEVIKSSVKVPFSQTLKSGMRTLDSSNEILENLRQVKINLPLLHVIKHVHTYTKVLKDLYTVKRKHHVKKTTFLLEQLDLGEFKPISIMLQLADHSVKKPRGIVEDVLIQIDKFYYHVDFLILDTSSVVDSSSKILLILGRHFLATANALINCSNGLMKLSFGNMTLEVDIFHIGKHSIEDDECHQIYMIDVVIDEGLHTTHDYDPLEYFLVNSEFNTSRDSYDVVDICIIYYETQDYRTQSW